MILLRFVLLLCEPAEQQAKHCRFFRPQLLGRSRKLLLHALLRACWGTLGASWRLVSGEWAEAARDAGRRDLFSYAVVDAYARAFERAGFRDEVAAVRAAHAAGDRDAAVAAVSDRMVDAIDICGDAATVRAAVQAYRDAGVEVPVIMPLPWGEDRVATIEATIDAVTA